MLISHNQSIFSNCSQKLENQSATVFWISLLAIGILASMAYCVFARDNSLDGSGAFISPDQFGDGAQLMAIQAVFISLMVFSSSTMVYSGYLYIKRYKKEALEEAHIMATVTPLEYVSEACISKVLSLACHDEQKGMDRWQAHLKCIQHKGELYFRYGKVETGDVTVISVPKVLKAINWQRLPKIYQLPYSFTGVGSVEWDKLPPMTQFSGGDCDIARYTGSEYYDINRFLRFKRCSVRNVKTNLYKVIRMVFYLQHQKKKIDPKTLLHRCVNLPRDYFLRTHRTGKIFQDDAFFSTSIIQLRNFDEGSGIPVYYYITSHSGVDIASQSVAQGEKEVLFMPKTPFRITAIRYGSICRISMEEVAQTI